MVAVIGGFGALFAAGWAMSKVYRRVRPAVAVWYRGHWPGPRFGIALPARIMYSYGS